MKIKFEKDVKSCEYCPFLSWEYNYVQTKYICDHPKGPKCDFRDIGSIHPDCPFRKQNPETSNFKDEIKLIKEKLKELQNEKIKYVPMPYPVPCYLPIDQKPWKPIITCTTSTKTE